MERESTESRLVYPLRPKPMTDRVYQPVSLVSNHYWVKFEPTHKIFIYLLDFSPKISSDVRTLKQRILSSEDVNKTLMNEIGFFVLTGSTVYGARTPSFQESLSFSTDFNGTTYKIIITLKKSFSIADIYHNEPRVSMPAFKFFNILVKHVLRSMKLLEFGRSSKYFNLDKSAAIPDTNLRIFHGYLTSFNHYQAGFFLKIDVTHKIVRTDTVLNYIDDIYSKYQNLSKDDKRKKVREALVYRTVLAMYGNYRYWRIDDIIFDKDCDTFEFEDEKEFQDKAIERKRYTITQYYKERYNMKVTKPRQPLILHIQARTNKVFYILPEFCVMTGLPEDIPETTRKNVTNLCIKLPHQRMSEIQSLMETMLKNDQGQNSQSQNSLHAIRDLGIEFQSDPVLFEGKLLPPPKVIVGKGVTIEDGGANFQLKKEIFDPGEDIYWAIICTADFECNKLIEHFKLWARQLGVKLTDPQVYDYGRKEEGRKAIIEIEDILERKVPGKFDIVIIILPNFLKTHYKAIKQKCYLKLGVLSQVVLMNTLLKKGYVQICSKLLQQVVSKVGSKLWIAQSPKGIYTHTMLIGVDTSIDKMDKNRTVIAFCASMDPTFSRYYSRVIYQKKSEDLIESMRTLVKDSTIVYNKLNGALPQHIIYFRDGVMEITERKIQETEIKHILGGATEAGAQEPPKVTILVIDKQITQKFFSVNQKKDLQNPPSGTVVDNTIVSKNYDFYLIAQNVNRGTATPTHYKVIYDDSLLPAEILQELVYSQCFAYMNWSGAIRIPAPCQYAHKLSSFVSQHINEEPVKPLRNHLYYL